MDEGEAAAIAQADYKQSILLIDEQKGYKRAVTMQVTIIRTGRLLNMLKEAGAIAEVKPYHQKLDEMGFHLEVEVRLQLLAEAGEE